MPFELMLISIHCLSKTQRKINNVILKSLAGVLFTAVLSCGRRINERVVGFLRRNSNFEDKALSLQQQLARKTGEQSTKKKQSRRICSLVPPGAGCLGLKSREWIGPLFPNLGCIRQDKEKGQRHSKHPVFLFLLYLFYTTNWSKVSTQKLLFPLSRPHEKISWGF